jgi:hypothetical protein
MVGALAGRIAQGRARWRRHPLPQGLDRVAARGAPGEAGRGVGGAHGQALLGVAHLHAE